jgi:hypothetical protein
MALSIFMDINMFSLFDRPVFGWLPWTPGASKIFVLSRNVLAISWPFIAHTQKNKSKNFFSKKKILKKITLKCFLLPNPNTKESDITDIY